MRNLLSIIISLTVITSVCGLALGALYEGTRERIEEQILINKQLPAAKKVLAEASNDLLAERQTLKVSEQRKTWRVIFPGKRQGKQTPYGLAFESISKKGYGGKIGVMVGLDVASGDLIGIAITTHSETPGIGARAATDDAFAKQFQGVSPETNLRVKQDGGQIDALTGATATSRAVCDAVQGALSFYNDHSEEIGRLVGGAGPASEGGGGR